MESMGNEIVKYRNSSSSRPPLPPIPKNNENAIPENVNEQQLAIANQPNPPPLDPNFESKRDHRLMASRRYSQRYRLKQLNYVIQLEQRKKAFEADIAVNGPAVGFYRSHYALVLAEQEVLKQKIAAISDALLFKEALTAELRKERDIHSQIYQAQQMQEMQIQQEQAQADCYIVDPVPAQNYQQYVDVNLNHPGFNPYLGPGDLNGAGPSQEFDPFENFNTGMNINQLGNFNSNINLNQPPNDQNGFV